MVFLWRTTSFNSLNDGKREIKDSRKGEQVQEVRERRKRKRRRRIRVKEHLWLLSVYITNIAATASG